MAQALGSEIQATPIQWPQDIADEVPELFKEELIKASLTFPDDTGLGWDKLHPKAIRRISDSLLNLLVRIMVQCELAGTWPAMVALVLIALLPKPEGGYRPIGLIPFLPRLWMRARKGIASKWEQSNARPFLFVGKGTGADVAAWIQGAAAELAAKARPARA